MIQNCPKCGEPTEGSSPNRPWYIEFICDGCACCWDERGNVMYEGHKG